MDKMLDKQSLINEILETIQEAKKVGKKKAKEAGEEIGETFGDGISSGLNDSKNDIKKTTGQLMIEWRKYVNSINNNKTQMKPIKIKTVLETAETLKDVDGFGETVKKQLSGIKATFGDVEVSGLDNVIEKFKTSADELSSIDWGFGKLHDNMKLMQEQADLGDKLVESVEKQTKAAVDGAKKQIEVQKQVNEQIQKQLKLTKLRNDKGGFVPESYTAVGGKYEIYKGTVGWNVYQPTEHGGFGELIATYETLKELRLDSVLIAEQEALTQNKLTEATEKAVKVQKQAIRELVNEIKKEQKASLEFYNLYTEKSQIIKKEQFRDKVKGIQVGINNRTDIKGILSDLDAVNEIITQVDNSCRDAVNEVDRLNDKIESFIRGDLTGKRSLQNAIQEAWGNGDKPKAAKLFEQYQVRFPDGKFNPDKLFGDDWANNFYKNLDDADKILAELREKRLQFVDEMALMSASAPVRLVRSDLERQHRRALVLNGDAKNREEAERIIQQTKATEDLTQVIESTTKSLEHQGKIRKTVSGLKDNTFVKNEQMKKLAVEATNAAIENHVKGAVSSYKDLYSILEKYVSLANNLKPDQLPEMDKIEGLASDISRWDLHDVDDYVKEIEAGFKNVQRIKTSQRNGLSVYQHVESGGHTYEERITNDTLKEAEAELDSYIYAAVQDFGENILNSFSQKKINSYVQKLFNNYQDVASKNDIYYDEARDFNEPIESQMKEIEDLIYRNIDPDNHGLRRKIYDIFSNLKNRSDKVDRYTLSYESNDIGDMLGVKTPYQEIRDNAKRIESYEELCDVVARYNELQDQNFGYSSGKGFKSESDEFEFKEIQARLRASGVEKIWDYASAFDGIDDKSLEKLAVDLNLHPAAQEIQKLNKYFEENRSQIYQTTGAFDQYEALMSEVKSGAKTAAEAIDGLNIKLGKNQTEISKFKKGVLPTNTVFKKKSSEATPAEESILDTYQSSFNEKETKTLFKGIDIDQIAKTYHIAGEERKALAVELEKLGVMSAELAKGDDGKFDANAHSQQLEKVVQMIISQGQNVQEVDKAFDKFLNYAQSNVIRYTEEDISEFDPKEWDTYLKRFGTAKGQRPALISADNGTPINKIWEQELIPELGLGIGQKLGEIEADNANDRSQFKQYVETLALAYDEKRDYRKKEYSGLDKSNEAEVMEEVSSFIERVFSNAEDIVAQAADAKNKSDDDKPIPQDIVPKNIDKQIKMLNDAEKLQASIANFKGVTDASKLEDQVKKTAQTILGADLTVGTTKITDSVSKISLVNKELGILVEQVWRLEKANKDAAASFKLMSLSAEQNPEKAQKYIEAQQAAEEQQYNKVISLQDKLYKKKKELAVLNVTKDSASSEVEQVRRLTNEYQKQYDESLRLINNEEQKNRILEREVQLRRETAKLSVEQNNAKINIKNEAIDNLESKMRNAEIHIENIKTSLEKLGNVNGAGKAAEAIERMVAASKEFREASDLIGKESAFNKYSIGKQDYQDFYKYATLENSDSKALSDLEAKMANVNTELNTMGMKLNKVLSVPGSSTAFEAFEGMESAVRKFNEAATLSGKQNAYAEYTKYQKQFTAEINNLNAAQREQAATQKESDNALKGYYKSLMTTLQGIESLNTKINSLKLKDNGTGTYLPLIQDLENQKSQLLAKVNDISKQMKSAFQGSFYQGYDVEIPFSNLLNSIGDEKVSNRLKGFFSDARVQAVLTEQEIEKFTATLQKSQNASDEFALKLTEKLGAVKESMSKLTNLVNSGAVSQDNNHFKNVSQQYDDLLNYMKGLSKDSVNWTGIETSTIQQKVNELLKYVNVLNQAAEKEAQYFAGKQKYADGMKFDNMNILSTDVKNTTSAIDKTKNDLSALAQQFAEGKAIITGFKQSADGISTLNFSVLDSATSSMRQFSMEMGTASKQAYLTETSISQTTKTIQNAEQQVNKMQSLLNTVSASGFKISGDGAHTSVARLVNLMHELNTAAQKGEVTTIDELMKKSKIATSEVQKLYNESIKLQNAIDDGVAKEITGYNVDSTVTDFDQLSAAVRKHAADVEGAALKVGKFDEKHNKLNYTLTHGNGNVEHYTASIDKLGKTINRQSQGVTKLQSGWKQLGGMITKSAKQMTMAIMGYNVFYQVIGKVRQGVTYIKEIDTAMTELKKVTDETAKSYETFVKNAAATGSKIGATVSDYVNATADFARLGYEMNEAGEMAQAAIVYKNVADGLDTIEESTESITSTMKAFGIESNDTMGIIDSFNEVGNNFAITSAGIGEALKRSASALYEGGNTLEESIGLITGANTVVNLCLAA